jgi:hypothetical protein
MANTIGYTNDWDFANHVADIILDHNGIIYGEFVVMSLRVHDDHNTPAPAVINATLTYDNIYKFKTACRRKGMHIVSTDNTNDVESSVFHVRPESSHAIKPVEVLLHHCHNIPKVPRVPEPNFECFSLLLSRQGIALSPQVPIPNTTYGKLDTINRIIDDIKNKRTRPSLDTGCKMDAMTKRLLADGWTIFDEIMTTITEMTCVDDVCIMCHEQLPNQHIKLHCCNGRYHAKCLIECINNGFDEQCIICRNPTYMGAVFRGFLGGCIGA